MNKLVFVYNGDSGMVNGIKHYLHKCVAPGTYPCRLCALVYDGISINREWQAFVQSLGIRVEYLHRNEYHKHYGKMTMGWPAVLLHDDVMMRAVVLSPGDFDSIESLDALKQRIGKFVSLAVPEKGLYVTAPADRLAQCQA